MYFAKNIANIISLLILGSVFSDCVVFYGDSTVGLNITNTDGDVH